MNDGETWVNRRGSYVKTLFFCRTNPRTDYDLFFSSIRINVCSPNPHWIRTDDAFQIFMLCIIIFIFAFLKSFTFFTLCDTDINRISFWILELFYFYKPTVLFSLFCFDEVHFVGIAFALRISISPSATRIHFRFRFTFAICIMMIYDNATMSKEWAWLEARRCTWKKGPPKSASFKFLNPLSPTLPKTTNKIIDQSHSIAMERDKMAFYWLPLTE